MDILGFIPSSITLPRPVTKSKPIIHADNVNVKHASSNVQAHHMPEAKSPGLLERLQNWYVNW